MATVWFQDWHTGEVLEEVACEKLPSTGDEITISGVPWEVRLVEPVFPSLEGQPSEYVCWVSHAIRSVNG